VTNGAAPDELIATLEMGRIHAADGEHSHRASI
jgi:hypothetical protein